MSLYCLLPDTCNVCCYRFQRLADILFAAAEEGGLVDPHKIEQILKVPNPKNSATTSVAMTNTVTSSYFLAQCCD